MGRVCTAGILILLHEGESPVHPLACLCPKTYALHYLWDWAIKGPIHVCVHSSFDLSVLQVAESWAFGMLVLIAGLLPDPTRSVASTSIAFNTYGITYMPFLAESIAVSTR